MELTVTESFIKRLEGLIFNVADSMKLSESRILSIIAVLLVVFLFSKAYKGIFVKLPPGPIGLPFVGYAPFLSSDAHLDFVKLGKKYGEVFSLTLGTKTVIVLNGINSIKEAFSKPEFLGRPPDSIFSWIFKKSPFFVQDVHVWKEHRRFLFHIMKDLGLGRKSMQVEIENEIRQFLDVIRSHQGDLIDPCTPLCPSTSNNISALLFGKRYEYGHSDRQMLDSSLEELYDCNAQASLPTFYPWTRHIPFMDKVLGIGKGMAGGARIRDFFRREIEKRRKPYNENSRDYIDGYLKEMESKKGDSNTSFKGDILPAALLDIFVAGSETVPITVLWLIYTMATYPEVQKKVQKELRDVIGQDRCPEFVDHKCLPYTHAVILEVMRWKPVVPVNIMRYTMKDTSVGGHHIPKNMIAMANFWAVHHDPSLWNEPHKFNPERFLSPDGKSVVKSANFLPFSLGKRSCPGESMANMEVFLYFASIMNEFNVLFPEGFTPTFDAKLNATYRLNPFKVKFEERKLYQP